MKKINELPEELQWNIIKMTCHPMADAFKKGLKEELDDHFRVLKEGPGYEENWCADDEWTFAYEHFKQKLYMEKKRSDQFWNIYTYYNAPWVKKHV